MPQEAATFHADRRRLRRRLLLVVISYLLAVLVSALVARAGLAAARTGADRIGLPWALAGTAGMFGAGTLAIAAWYARRGLDAGHGVPPRLARAVLLARVGRIGMGLAAITAAVLGVVSAPEGAERGFAILVSVGLAALLALFALFANDLTRLRRQVAPPPERSVR
ncbi:hypothetical protein ACN27G_30080 [Plantactinospora sp. WMMB334]|uniref:hypothetical protein n=1 Tax=Plantactinospora sp. WMMB334 TaxID=3404119 RepID=UPI003B93D979